MWRRKRERQRRPSSLDSLDRFLDDWVIELDCGSVALPWGLPAFLTDGASGGIHLDLTTAARLNEFARHAYAESKYGIALTSYTRIVRLLGLWISTDAVGPNPTGSQSTGRSHDPARISRYLSEAYFNRANTRDELADYDGALSDYCCALTIGNSEPWNVRRNRALVLEKLGRNEEAKRDLLVALNDVPDERNQDRKAVERILARVRRWLNDDGWDESRDPELWSSTAWLDDLPECSASPDALRSQRIDAVSLAAALNNFGSERYRAADYQRAQLAHTRQIKLLTAWIAAHATDPSFNGIDAAGYLSTAYYNRANNWLRLKRNPEALADCDRAIELGNAEPWEPLINRALVYEQMGRLRYAERDLSRAQNLTKDLWPDGFPGIQNALDRVRRHHATSTRSTSTPSASNLPHSSSYGAGAAAALTAMATELLERYDQTMHDDVLLEQATQTAREAVAASDDDSDLLSESCNIYGATLRARHLRYGDMADLEAAIDCLRTAIDASSETHRSSDTVAGNLGACLRLRALRKRNVDDLDESIPLLRRATSNSSATAFSNLGNALRNRYRMTGDWRDLDEAVSVLRSATDPPPPSPPATESAPSVQPIVFNNLGNALLDRYRSRGNQTDLSAAIPEFEKAADSCADGAPEQIMFTTNLASALAERQRHAPDPGDLDRATALFQKICSSGMGVAPEGVLQAAQDWGSWALQRNSWKEAVEAFNYGMAAAGSLYEAQSRGDAQALRSSREVWLRDARIVPTAAGYAHGKVGLLEEAALDFEQGRAALLADTLTRRFFSRPEYELIRDAAAENPLVYIATTPSGGLALVVRPGGSPTPVWLPNLTQKNLLSHVRTLRQSSSVNSTKGHDADLVAARRAAAAARRARSAALDDITQWLWAVAVGPVLDELADAEGAVFVPGGLLGLLPLHAAWTPDATRPTGRRYALDHLTISYAPSARALKTARERAAEMSSCHRLLSVVDPAPMPPPDVQLPAAGDEAAGFAAYGGLDRTELAGIHATPGRFRRLAPESDVLHLACHGWADLDEPLRSGLLMAGGHPVVLQELMELRLRVRLAVLSACETALPGTELPDEVIGLPTGLLQAGAAGVVASQWGVLDAATAMLMTEFARRWAGGRTPPALALRRAQQWLRDTTNEEKRAHWQAAAAGEPALPNAVVKSFLDSLAFGEAGARNHADLPAWAAFTHVGA